MNVFAEFAKIAAQLQKHEIRYALIGGVAVAFHDQPRFTKDIDLLITADQIEKIGPALNEAGFHERSEPWFFSDSRIKLHRFIKFQGEDHLFVDVLIGQEERHASIIANALKTELDSGWVQVATAEDLIWLKKFRNSKHDQADIERLRHGGNAENDKT